MSAASCDKYRYLMRRLAFARDRRAGVPVDVLLRRYPGVKWTERNLHRQIRGEEERA